MKRILSAAAALLFLCSPALAAGPASPIQFPAQIPGQRPGVEDPFTNIESQQIMQETLLIMRDMVTLLRESPAIQTAQKERLDLLSSRIDYLVTRQQDLAMRQRMGRP